MKAKIFTGLLCLGLAAHATGQVDTSWYDGVVKAQAEAFETGKAERVEISTQEEILICKAYWEGFSEVLFEEVNNQLSHTVPDEYAYSAIDYWSQRLETSDYDAERAFLDEAYTSLLYFAADDVRIAATKILGRCAPPDLADKH